MPSYTIYANADDYQIQCRHATVWNTAKEGAGTLSASSNTNASIGPNSLYDTGTSQYKANQAFLHFDTTVISGTETAASLVITVSSRVADFTIEAREKTWTGSGTGNFTAGSALSSLVSFSSSGIVTNSTGAKTFTKTNPVITRSATYGIILYDENQRTGTTPGSHPTSNLTIHSADATGTTNDPYLSITTIAGGKIKVWNGSAWVEKPVKFWDGSAWVEKPLKFWDGSAWVLS